MDEVVKRRYFLSLSSHHVSSLSRVTREFSGWFMSKLEIFCKKIFDFSTKFSLRSEKRMRQHSKNQNAVPNNLRNPSQASPNLPSVSSGAGSSNGKPGAFPKATRIKDQREVKQKRNEWRITKMVLAIFLSFLICYLPITIIKIFDKDVKSPGIFVFFICVTFLKVS